MKSPLRIALVIYGLARHAGGLSMYVRNFSKALCDAGHRVTVVTTNAGPHGSSGDDPVELDPRVELVFFRIPSAIQRRIYRSTALRRWLAANLDRFDVVDIQGVWSFVTIDAANVCLRGGKAYVLTPHGNMARWDWQKRPLAKQIFFALFLRSIWRRAARIRFLSIEESASSRISAGSKGLVIANAVDAEELRAVGSDVVARLRARLDVASDARLLVFLGRVTDQKGILETLDAFDAFASRDRYAVLVVAGPHDAGYGDEVSRKVDSMTHRDRVRVIGPVYGEERNALMAEATAFVTLSKNEGQPIAVLEALAGGVPVLITAQSNLPAVAERDAGVIVSDARNQDRVVAAMGELCRGRNGRADNARALIETAYSWRATLPTIEEMYRGVVTGAPS